MCDDSCVYKHSLPSLLYYDEDEYWYCHEKNPPKKIPGSAFTRRQSKLPLPGFCMHKIIEDILEVLE